MIYLIGYGLTLLVFRTVVRPHGATVVRQRIYSSPANLGVPSFFLLAPSLIARPSRTTTTRMSTLASTRSRTSTSTSTSTASQSHSHSQTRSQSGTQSQSETDEKGQAEQTQAQTVETETEAEAETPTPTAPFMPSWLERACDDVEYQRYAYSELADRERIREEARKVSRGVKSRTKSFLSTFTGNLFSSTSSSNGSGSDPNTGGESQSTSERLHGGHYDIRIGWTDKNMGENRYRDIIPFDRTRVTVSIDGHPEGRYLNANWVRELYGGMWWIASQAPLPNTAHAFLGLFVQK